MRPWILLILFNLLWTLFVFPYADAFIGPIVGAIARAAGAGVSRAAPRAAGAGRGASKASRAVKGANKARKAAEGHDRRKERKKNKKKKG